MKYVPFWEGRLVDRQVQSSDGVNITYQSLGEGTDKVIAVANGLGGRLYTWEPLIRKVWPEYRIITWDYRGLFDSDDRATVRRLAINNHAEDLHCILEAEGISRVSAVVGWSMGVQVALEFAALFPEEVEKLVLINGTYGHALATGFQPIFRIPYMNEALHGLIEFLHGRRSVSRFTKDVLLARPIVSLLGMSYSLITGNRQVKYALAQYLEDVFGHSFDNYLRLFQELDAHSTYHHLRDIGHPVLVVWGTLDPLTPAYLSKRLVRRLPNAQKMRVLFGTHFVLLEHPEKVPNRILRFLKTFVPEPA
ncbi:MAG: alpha/beta fold hydrolase [Desulfatibacillaceae bacterium]